MTWRNCRDLLGLAVRSPEHLLLYAVACGDGTVYVTEEFGPLAVMEHAVRGTVLAVVELRRFSVSLGCPPPEVGAAAAEAVDALAHAVGLRDPYEVSNAIEVETHRVVVRVSAPRWLLPLSIARSAAAPGCPSCRYPSGSSKLAVLGEAEGYAATAAYRVFTWLPFSLTRWRVRRRLARSYPHLLAYTYTTECGWLFPTPCIRITVPCPTKGLRELFARLAEAGLDFKRGEGSPWAEQEETEEG